MIDPMKYNVGFLSGSNGIFGDKNDKDNQSPKKTRKTGRSLSFGVNSILNNADDSRDINNNVIISNIDSTHRQERETNNKRDGKSKSRLSYKNKDIKYQNNKKKGRKKVKSSVQNKRYSNNEDSTDDDNNDSVPGLQDCCCHTENGFNPLNGYSPEWTDIPLNGFPLYDYYTISKVVISISYLNWSILMIFPLSL